VVLFRWRRKEKPLTEWWLTQLVLKYFPLSPESERRKKKIGKKKKEHSSNTSPSFPPGVDGRH
jgi:hypothetical protein